MSKLSDLNESERKRCKVDKSGNVLCLHCGKNLAKVSEYGMLRRCEKCEKERFGPMVSISEPSGVRYY